MLAWKNNIYIFIIYAMWVWEAARIMREIYHPIYNLFQFPIYNKLKYSV